MNDNELLYTILDMLKNIVTRLEKLETAPAKPIPTCPVDAAITLGLPAIDDMSNVELTFFDNGRAKGRTQFRIKAEINTVSTKFAQRRDFEAIADLYDPIELRLKLNKRKISEEYRDTIMTLIASLDKKGADPAWIGMFGIKGGKPGQQWFDHQLVIVFHNGEHKPLYAVLNVNDKVMQLSPFDHRMNPKTKKPFQLSNIKGKSIDVIEYNEEGERI